MIKIVFKITGRVQYSSDIETTSYSFWKVEFLGGSDDKESACIAGDPGSIPGSGRSPGEGNGNTPQYSCWRSPWTEGPSRL